MIKENVKFQNSCVFEGMTSIRSIIKGFEIGVNNRQIKTVLYDFKKYNKNIKHIGYLKAVSKNMNFEIVESTEDEINNLCLGTSHGGIIAICEERTIPSFTADSDILKNGFYCMIQGIEDPYNFGYALRSL